MVSFFGKVDRQENTGKIRSQYPAWTMDNAVDELRESVASKRRMLDRKLIPLDQLPNYEAELERDEQRLKEIEESRPELKGEKKDELAKQRDQLGEKIADSMFTLTEMEMGLASPNEEAHRMVDPVIGVGGKMLTTLKDMGIKPIKGKISRNQAQKAWKIISKALDEDTNPERLRRSGETSRRYIVR